LKTSQQNGYIKHLETGNVRRRVLDSVRGKEEQEMEGEG